MVNDVTRSIRKLTYRLSMGFAGILFLMLVLSVLALNSIDATQQKLTGIVHKLNVKTELVTAMRNAARERTISMYRMIALHDPFEQDEEYMRFNGHGAQFAEARVALLAMDLTAKERSVLDRQGEITSVAVEVQAQVVDLVQRGEVAQAERLLLQESVPMQDRVFEQLVVLLNIQKLAAAHASSETAVANSQARTSMLVLGAIALISGLLIAVVIIRITRRNELGLYQEKERAQTTLTSIGEAVVTINNHGEIELLNPVAERMTGFTAADARGMNVSEVLMLHEELTGKRSDDPVLAALQENRIVASVEPRILQSRGGEHFIIEYTAAPVHDAQGATAGAVLVFRNVTEVHDLAKQIAYQASHDFLTDLINRHEFEKRLEHALHGVRAKDQNHVLCYLDLDQFKVVNDTCGHVAGDELLKQLTALFKTRVRKTDTLARLGGDEFALLISDCEMPQAMEIAEELRQLVHGFRFVWEGASFEISASIGMVPLTAASGTLADILAAADSACYAAKGLGRNQVYMYKQDDKILARWHGDMQWIGRIRETLEASEFQLFIQNIYPLTPGDHQHAAEILLRMQDHSGTLVPPGAFIPAAERYNLMPDVDRWVVHNALDAINRLNRAGRVQSVDMWSINLSGQTLGDEGFVSFVIDAIEHHGLNPASLCLEITETAAVANLTRVREMMLRLCNLGCRFALDDFGSGLSSFAYLKNLPVSYIKIDGGFVRDMLDNSMDIAIVDAINQIGRVLGLETIAEYVEDEETLNRLRLMGVAYAQGNFLHEPVALEPLITEVRVRQS